MLDSLTPAQRLLLVEELLEAAGDLRRLAEIVKDGESDLDYVSEKIFDATHGGEIMDLLP